MELNNIRIVLPTKFSPDQGTVELITTQSSSPSSLSVPTEAINTGYSELHFKNFTGIIRLESQTPTKVLNEGM